ncbi:MAG: cupin domain-containing protein [Ignavibacteria bacterium]|nr:cupin domain-containing protein [Ignavibacteria bacterium]
MTKQEQPAEQTIDTEKMDLQNLLSYQPNSIVSRVLLKKPSGTITVFAFAEGEGLSEHTAPFDAYVQILDGEAEITISSKSVILKSGEVIIMPANKPHSLKAISEFKMLLVMIKS